MVIEIINCAANVIIASSVIATIFSLRNDIKTRKEDLRHDKCQATLEAYSRLQNEAPDSLYKNYTPASVKEIAKNNRTDEYRELSTLAARIEHFAAGANKEIYDKETVYSPAHGFPDGTIKSRIEPLPERKNSGEAYYSNINELYEWMKSKDEAEKDKNKKN